MTVEKPGLSPVRLSRESQLRGIIGNSERLWRPAVLCQISLQRPEEL